MSMFSMAYWKSIYRVFAIFLFRTMYVLQLSISYYVHDTIEPLLDRNDNFLSAN